MPASVNTFKEPESYDLEIYQKKPRERVGELRVKPSSILWKPKGAQKYSSVSLEKFAEWMMMKDKKKVAK